jgi:hypothetical protein
MCKKGQRAKVTRKFFEARHNESLIKQKCRGKSICKLRNSKAWNFFIGNPRAPNSDNLIKFIIRARNDTLWASARKTIIFKEKGSSTSCTCGNKRFCNLLHILNNWTYNMKEMKTRHNTIQDLRVESIKNMGESM